MNNSKAILWALLGGGFSAFLSACVDRPPVTPSGQPPEIHAAVAANLCSPAKAQYQSYYNEELDKRGLEELATLAADGNTDAMVLLGMRYTPGYKRPAGLAGDAPGNAKEYVPPQADMDKSLGLFQAAAEKQSSHAEFLVGVAYINGQGAPKDEAKALDWFRRAATHGSAHGQFWTGEMLAKGRGGAGEDWKSALPFFAKAADGGSAEAFVELGYAYYYGLGGLDKDDQKSGFCARQGVKLKSQIAQFSLLSLLQEGVIAREEGDPEIRPAPPGAPDK